MRLPASVRSSWACCAALLGMWLLSGCGSPTIPEEAGKSAPGTGTASTGGASGQTRRLIFLTNSESPFWDAARAGLQDANKELKLNEVGLEAVMVSNTGGDEGQLDKLRQFASQSDVAGIAISVAKASNAAIAEALKNFRDKGIPVVTVDSDVDRDKYASSRVAFIGTDNRIAGTVAGKCVAGLRPEGGEYVCFVGFLNAQNAIDRIDGVKEGAGDKNVLKDSMEDGDDRGKAREIVRNALLTHPNLNTLVGIYSYNAPAIVDVVREKKVRDAQKIVVFDADPLTIQAMAEGDIDAMIVQNPYAMGMESMRLLKALVTKDESAVKEMFPNLGQPRGDIFDTVIKVVVPPNSPLKKEVFGDGVDFLTLEEFKAWLAKYNLTQS